MKEFKEFWKAYKNISDQEMKFKECIGLNY